MGNGGGFMFTVVEIVRVGAKCGDFVFQHLPREGGCKKQLIYRCNVKSL